MDCNTATKRRWWAIMPGAAALWVVVMLPWSAAQADCGIYGCIPESDISGGDSQSASSEGCPNGQCQAGGQSGNSGGGQAASAARAGKTWQWIKRVAMQGGPPMGGGGGGGGDAASASGGGCGGGGCGGSSGEESGSSGDGQTCSGGQCNLNRQQGESAGNNPGNEL